MLNGLSDEDVKREVLGDSNLDEKSLEETIKLVEGKEVGLRSVGGIKDQSSGVTGYKRGKKIAAMDKRLSEKGKCESCKEEFLVHGVVKKAGKDDLLKRYRICKSSFDRKKAERKRDTETAAEGAISQEQFAFLGAVESSYISDSGYAASWELAQLHGIQIASVRSNKTNGPEIVVPNFIWEAGAGWVKRQNDPHP